MNMALDNSNTCIVLGEGGEREGKGKEGEREMGEGWEKEGRGREGRERRGEGG